MATRIAAKQRPKHALTTSRPHEQTNSWTHELKNSQYLTRPHSLSSMHNCNGNIPRKECNRKNKSACKTQKTHDFNCYEYSHYYDCHLRNLATMCKTNRKNAGAASNSIANKIVSRCIPRLTSPVLIIFPDPLRTPTINNVQFARNNKKSNKKHSN